MDRSDIAYLIGTEWNTNLFGVLEPVRSTRKVFCKVSSVSSSEWFEGGRNGLNPQYQFLIFKHDYENEKLIEYKDVVYLIYRTYERSVDEIELYAELRDGKQ